MDKKIRFSDQPRRVKIIYLAVIGVLCVTAVVIGIVSAANRKPTTPEDEGGANLPPSSENTPPPTDGGETNEGENNGDAGDGGHGDNKPEKFTMVSPVVGRVTKTHSLEIPVFSDTLNAWRVHAGIDISCEEGAEVYAAADGVVSRVYSDPLLGKTVEITHEGGIVSLYSNLSATDVALSQGDEVKSGALIGKVGDTAISELADESHLHFAVKVGGTSVNPLDYISEESKEASLGLGSV